MNTKLKNISDHYSLDENLILRERGDIRGLDKFIKTIWRQIC